VDVGAVRPDEVSVGQRVVAGGAQPGDALHKRILVAVSCLIIKSYES
jgi:hypothetical protein